MENPDTNTLIRDSALKRLAMWDTGLVRNPNETAFAINNLNAVADIPCNSVDRAGFWGLLHSGEPQAVQPFVVTERPNDLSAA